MKSHKNNPSEQHVLTFRLIGFIMAAAMAYTALNWKTYSNGTAILPDDQWESKEDIELPEIVQAFQQHKPKRLKASIFTLDNSISLDKLLDKMDKKEPVKRDVGDDFDDLFTDGDDDKLKDDSPVFKYVQTPEFPGGEDSLIRYIKNRFEYPVNLKGTGIQGVVYMAFSVDKKGKVKDVKVVRGLQPRHMSKSIDDSLIKILENMPNWTPGEKDGYEKTMTMSLPVNIVVQ